MTTFADLGLSDELLKAVQDIGYTTPTPIQEQAIPPILFMRDVLACAQTGTGKTAGFTLPMIDILASGRARARMPRSLILEPTRELAAQVAENFSTYGKYHKLSMALLVGGETMNEQIANLDKGVDVLIATPGRMLDLQERGKILLNDIKIFVIDEADRMLDMGFIPDIEKIAGLLPPLRQTLFFSATMPVEIKKLAQKFLQNPKEITVSPPATTSVNIHQAVVPLPTQNDWQKREALRMILGRENVLNAFIFCNRKSDVALLHKSLKKHGFNVGALHGDMEQSERTATLEQFKSGAFTFLVCSDVAARGLDVPDVSHVFNFDVPFHAEDYVHRIGRTGRAGHKGTAYTLVTPEDSKQLAAIESLIKKELEREVLEGLPEPSKDVGARRGRGERPHREKERGETGRSAPRARHERKPSPAAVVPTTPTDAVAAPAPVTAPVSVAAPTSAAIATPAPERKRRPAAVAKPKTAPLARSSHPADENHPAAIANFGDRLPSFLRAPVIRKKIRPEE